MGIELNGTNDIVRRNGNLPDEVLATKAGSSLTYEEVAYLESLPPQSKLKQAYLASTAKTELQAYQVTQTQALVAGFGNRQWPRAAIMGTSIMEPRQYRQSTSFTNNGDGTFTLNFAATVRPLVGEGDFVQVTQGSAALNTRNAEVLSISGPGTAITVRPDTTLGLPVLIGVTPFIYANHVRQTNAIIYNAQSLFGGGFEVTVDATLGGGSTADFLQFIDRDLLDRANEFDFIVAELGGMNGVYARTNSFEVERDLSQQYIDKLASLGKPWLVLGILPRSSASGAWTSGKLNIVTQINRWAEDYVRSLGGSFIHPYKASYGLRSYLDITSADANPSVNEGSADGVHPHSGGALIQAAPIAEWVADRFAKGDALPASVKDAAIGLLNTNPFMLGTSGAKTGGLGATVSGTVADGYDVVVQAGAADTNIACSIVSRTGELHGDAIGNSQRLVITTGATASHLIELRVAANLSVGRVNGDGIFGVSAIDSTSGASPGTGHPLALRNLSMVCNAQTATTSNNFADSHGQGSLPCNRSAARQVLRSAAARFRAPLAVHGAPSNGRASVYISVGANASVCIDIGRVGCFLA